jgi:hypothetical protein
MSEGGYGIAANVWERLERIVRCSTVLREMEERGQLVIGYRRCIVEEESDEEGSADGW